MKKNTTCRSNDQKQQNVCENEKFVGGSLVQIMVRPQEIVHRHNKGDEVQSCTEAISGAFAKHVSTHSPYNARDRNTPRM